MELRQAPRDKPVLQEVRALQHQLGNQLGLVAGRAQLLSFESELPPVLRPDLAAIVDAALAAGRTLQRLQALTSPTEPAVSYSVVTGDRALAAPSPQSRHGASDRPPAFTDSAPVL